MQDVTRRREVGRGCSFCGMIRNFAEQFSCRTLAAGSEERAVASVLQARRFVAGARQPEKYVRPPNSQHFCSAARRTFDRMAGARRDPLKSSHDSDALWRERGRFNGRSKITQACISLKDNNFVTIDWPA